ncbi:MAG: OprD family outer membrane porin, partial [Sulfurimonadaceae bacterium]|nr:OprD family outer membrane porin [Sulfurimonadaceae bacterium]
MKKIFFIAWSFFTLSSLHAMQEANETNLIDASIDFRTFYYYGERENRAEREALAIGGILKATTQKFYGLSGSVAFYTSHDMLHYGADADMRYGTFDRSNIAGGSELVLSNGDAIDTIGEAYIEYSFAQTSLRYGRQRINTPLVNDFYNRFLPNSFEAITLESHEIENTKLFLSNISRWKYKSEADFKKFTTDSSSFKSLYIAGVEHTLTKDTKFSLYYYRMPQMLHSGYIEVDTSESLTQEINLRTQLHYLYQKSLQDALLGDIDTYLAGAKITLDYRNSWYLSALLDKVGNDTIRATGADYANLGLSSFINYTDLQIDGEALNAKALSYGII